VTALAPVSGATVTAVLDEVTVEVSVVNVVLSVMVLEEVSVVSVAHSAMVPEAVSVASVARSAMVAVEVALSVVNVARTVTVHEGASAPSAARASGTGSATPVVTMLPPPLHKQINCSRIVCQDGLELLNRLDNVIFFFLKPV